MMNNLLYLNYCAEIHWDNINSKIYVRLNKEDMHKCGRPCLGNFLGIFHHSATSRAAETSHLLIMGNVPLPEGMWEIPARSSMFSSIQLKNQRQHQQQNASQMVNVSVRTRAPNTTLRVEWFKGLITFSNSKPGTLDTSAPQLRCLRHTLHPSKPELFIWSTSIPLLKSLPSLCSLLGYTLWSFPHVCLFSQVETQESSLVHVFPLPHTFQPSFLLVWPSNYNSTHLYAFSSVPLGHLGESLWPTGYFLL